MMNNPRKEIAKFFCGWESFHALFHAYLLVSGTRLTVLGITTTPTMNTISLCVNILLAVGLGFYAWRPAKPRKSE